MMEPGVLSQHQREKRILTDTRYTRYTADHERPPKKY